MLLKSIFLLSLSLPAFLQAQNGQDVFDSAVELSESSLTKIIICPTDEPAVCGDVGCCESSDAACCRSSLPEFSCGDTFALGELVSEALQEILHVGQRLRELSFQASNGALGNIERGFLDDEFEALREHVYGIIDSVKFRDDFLELYYVLRDGIEFETRVPVLGGKFFYLREFALEALRQAELGTVFKADVELLDLTTYDTPVSSFKLNGLPIRTSRSSDAVSTVDRGSSAIAFVAAISREAEATGVEAEVYETSIYLGDISYKELVDLNALREGEFLINGISVQGGLASVSDLIDLVNNYSSSTGVNARLRSGSTDDVELYAADGRNIDLEFGYTLNNRAEKIKSALRLSQIDGDRGIIRGSFELFSSKIIQLKGKTGPLRNAFTGGHVDSEGYHPLLLAHIRRSLDEADISTQLGAQNSIRVTEAFISELNTRFIQANEMILFCRD